ncbi:hypothetical protein KDAU_30770 [Dictyobacter aurantiacus]|uniref:Cytosine-specific methyltransferase n=1 Tax=Dictyobacter aurantiacus TaxID=1936993 RepID=A0A401ZGD2_9CHLR|nr:hypothetical protein KDAU_30770 [Dictyobacter aurantiacus]
MSRLGHTCVFACEINQGLQQLYKTNFGIEPMGDIRNIPIDKIPVHDILCAGFPCQPFSKAGEQKGLDCPKWGDLFEYVIKILKERKPEYIMLENVPNLEKHNNGTTWREMEEKLKNEGYDIDYKRLSPHKFGIPQVRERIIIIGCRSGLRGHRWPDESSNANLSIISALEHNPTDAKPLSPSLIECLNAWQEFINSFPKDLEFPSFPIWSMEFGATYPFKDTTPYAIGVDELRNYKGSHGKPLAELADDNIMKALPSHARKEEMKFPSWKVRYIQQNRDLYLQHKSWIDQWMPSILSFPSSLQKLEWNCKGEERNIWNFVLQIRASGVRVKRPTTSPSLIAQTDTQVPIIAWEKRYMTPRECAALQSMQSLPNLPATREQAFKALGNAVNVDLVELVAKALLPSALENFTANTVVEENLVLS